MIIGVDVDDVLVDLFVPIMHFHNKHHGTNHKKEDLTIYDLAALWNCSQEEAVQRIMDFYHSSEFDNLLPRNDAIAAIRELAKNNTLNIITSRSTVVKQKTLLWLSRHFEGCFSQVHFARFIADKVGKKKAEICVEIGAQVLVEDNLDFARSAAEKGVNVILFDHPWNQTKEDIKNLVRVRSWSEALAAIESLANA